MKLNKKELANKEQWKKANITLPAFDREKVTAATKANPTWVHFGAGNIFRAHPAMAQQKLLEKGIADTGIIVAEGYDYEIIDAVFTPHDDLSLIVSLRADGGIDKTVVGSIVESLKLEPGTKDFDRMREIFRAPSLQMASFTITEKGYNITRGDELLPDVAADFKNAPEKATSYLGKIASLVHERYAAGKLPASLVSMDNCSHNGDRLKAAVTAFAEKWCAAGLAEKGFLDYVADKSKVGFPWSMIDKITPRPDESVKKMLLDSGFEDVNTVETKKHTFVAPFVNAEEIGYLVIEDAFPNGRPALDRAGIPGIVYADRATVDKVEKMKVCTCLNPLHTALAIYGCLLGHTKISAEMKDADLKTLIEKLCYGESLAVVVDPGIIKPTEFLKEVLNTRFPNPFMPDTPQRIACDTSLKLSIRFGETIKAYAADPKKDVKSLKLIPLVLAGWCRYLLAVDDEGRAFEVSPDPMYAEMSAHLKGIKLGDKGSFHAQLQPILSDARIFAMNLYEAGLGEKVENYFAELVAAPGAVRKTLKKYIA